MVSFDPRYKLGVNCEKDKPINVNIKVRTNEKAIKWSISLKEKLSDLKGICINYHNKLTVI